MNRYVIILLAVFSFEAMPNEYAVKYLRDSQQLLVKACLDTNIDYLVNSHRNAKRYLNLTAESKLKAKRGKLYINSTNGQCIEYAVSLLRAKKDRLAYKVGDSWLLNNLAWLWVPPQQHTIEMRFSNEDNTPLSVSAPWPMIADQYILGNTPSHWTSRIAFGNLHLESVDILDKHVNVAIINTPDKTRKQEYIDWIKQAAMSLTRLYGSLPIDASQILVVPIGPQKEAVPWAEVQRNGHPAIHFFVDSNRPITEFHNDWTAAHEFSHLLLPRISYQDRWVSEGLASYYQYIVKSKVDMLTTEQAWAKFTAGLERGRGKADRPLSRSRQTKHVYWGGAAIFLLADIKLRQNSPDKSLNLVLKEFSKRYLPSNEAWTAKQLMTKFDNISQTTVFTKLLEQQVMQNAFPISKDDELLLEPTNNPIVNAIFASND